jgi:hypothetical protein
MNRNFRDLLAASNAHGVECLLVGAHAFAAHGLVRATRDLDVWVRPEPRNAQRVLAALREFKTPLHDLTAEDLSRPGLEFQIGVEPIRIDVLTAVDGVQFEDAWRERAEVRLGDLRIDVISRRHLVLNKRALGREKDLLDVKWLESHTP